MSSHIIKMFIKFGEEKYLKDLYYNGTIYMNSIQYFRNIEDEELRGDKYEGISRIKNYPQGRFEIPEFNFKGNYLALQIRQSYETVLGNIYSLYCISSHGWDDPLKFRIDSGNKRFGSHCIVVKDNKKFLTLIENRLNELKVKFTHNFVEYYDKDKIDRTITLFEKPLEFEYQKEFRIYVKRLSEKPFIFNIGNITDIAEIYNSNEIIDTLKLTKSIYK